jgi:hypothetical protein
MEIVLIPGRWLDGSSWDEVVPALEHAGHRTRALTLPGMESKGADRSEITLRDHVDAVVKVIDSFDPTGGKVVLVGHSGGGAIAHAANGEVPLPDRSLSEEEDLVDLDDELRAAFRERAIPSPVHVTSDRQQLTDAQFTRPEELGRAILASVGPA